LGKSVSQSALSQIAQPSTSALSEKKAAAVSSVT
jgi:hypothetical protein